MRVNILGTEYERVVRSQKRQSRMFEIATYMAALSFYTPNLFCLQRGTKEVDWVAVANEYELILQKKSNLPKKQRDQVVHMFRREFREVEVNQEL